MWYNLFGDIMNTLKQNNPDTPVVNRTPTPRELQVLSLVAQGYDSKSAAKKIGISKRTVDFHLSNVYVKLNVGNRIQAINIAKAKGYL